MAPDLRSELKQTRPFRSLGHEAHVAVLRTAAVLEHQFETLLKPFGITATQYNALRILRGARPDGLCRNEVAERLIRRVPDVTRLLDRLEHHRLIVRERGGRDRRLVTTRITREGMAVLARLDPVVDRFERERLGLVADRRLRALVELLAEVRDGAFAHPPQRQEPTSSSSLGHE